MHVVTTRRQHGDRVYETHLLRRSYREDGKVKNQTLGNLSHLPPAAIEAVKAVLRGQTLVPAGAGFECLRSLPHGHVAAVTAMAGKLGFPRLLGEACPARDIVFALLVARVVRPASKLATRRWWKDTTPAADLKLAHVSKDDVYTALDWLLARQDAIEAALARKHLANREVALFDVSSSWVTGRCCPLAAYGYSRDARHDYPQITYGLLGDRTGRPVAIRVHDGNTADPVIFTEVPGLLKDTFKLREVIVVGDRGMLTTARIDALRDLGGIGWVSALRAPAVAALAADNGPLQRTLFDVEDLAEISHPDYPDERLVACYNPALAGQRARKRADLLAATETRLTALAARVHAGRLADPMKIAFAAGKITGKHKMAKHFTWTIDRATFAFSRDEASIAAEAALDGIYVLRTNTPTATLPAADVVRTYKALAGLERDFRSLKTVDLDFRPIRHHTKDRVRAHALLCMLARYLLWHLEHAWAPLTFTDETPPERPNPVAAARRSQAAAAKASSGRTTNDQPALAMHDLLDHLATLTRNTIHIPATHATFDQLTAPTTTQRRAFELLNTPIPQTLA